TKCDGYTDHGHDHAGVDRGADTHPFIGYNYRISELHAAIGLAQIGKLDQFLAIQKKNHDALKTILSTVPEIGFRRIPDVEGDSRTFLSWFLPTEAIARAVVAELRQQNVLAGNFYWFDNNWHYFRKWDHLRQAATLNNLNEGQRETLVSLRPEAFPASDAILSRCVSTAIGLGWTDAQTAEKGEKIVAAVRKVLVREKAAV
ncbi:MAG TPA: DegT/DnrJ/EryC1/StrS family aminotransferase, partial [Puia sp.]